MSDVGCNRCWPDDAVAAWQARDTFLAGPALIDESHFSVTILACRHCDQSFVSVFTETIDWADGDDPQSWTLLPITADETAALIEKGESFAERELNGLGFNRRSLRVEHPKGAERRVFWDRGVSVGHHD